MNSIAAIIAAYNEEQTIGDVVQTLKKTDIIDKIIIISDGSTDKTVNIAEKYDDVTVVDIKDNIGKGAAVMKGLDLCQSIDIVLLLDADLIGLREEHIQLLLNPIIDENWDMTIGLFKGGRMSTDIAQRITPFLSGQRALKKELLENIPNKDINQYGLESAITNYVKKHKIAYKTVRLSELTHRTKEEKMGIFRGFAERIKMYVDVFKAMKRK